MYKIIKRLKDKERLRKNKRNDKILNLVITMFISFSLLNVFLIFNFMNLLNTIGKR